MTDLFLKYELTYFFSTIVFYSLDGCNPGPLTKLVPQTGSYVITC